MIRGTRAPAVLLAALLLAAAPGCRDAAPPGDDHDHDLEAEATAEAAGGAVAIPAAVRRNLGITFAQVERRDVARTLRVPGRFELLPTARREYRTMLPGRVELLVEQYEAVEAGAPLYRIDSPAWREMQQSLSEAEAALARLVVKVETFAPLVAAHDEHERSLRDAIAVWSGRVEQLEAVREAGGGRVSELAEARSSLASARAELANVQEKKAELAAERAEAAADLAAAQSRRAFLLDSAASLLRTSAASLAERAGPGDAARPRWATIDMIDVRADAPGVVESLGLTNGAWADQKSTVLVVVRPDRLRFHAQGLQSDLGLFRDGLSARIVPPAPTKAAGAIDLQDAMDGVLALGLAGDPNDRTVDLYVTPARLAAWALPGVSAQLEIVVATDGGAAGPPPLAIPLAAVQRDGIRPVIFRRDPRDPDRALRLDADLGLDDGRWVVVRSGLRDGDEVVLDGAFQLMLAASGTMQRGGHFHSDGTFHEGEH